MSNRGKAAYLMSCMRADAACAVSQLSQVNASKATEVDCRRLDGDFKQLCSKKNELLYGNVELSTACVFVLEDASFATNLDLSS